MEQSLAVKYRPTKFEDVCGQSEVKVILQNQLDSGEVKHAYLFCGGAGTGKTTCARIFANKINHGEGTPIELDAASNNSVDDVRDIIQDSKTASLDSEYKVYIIDECVTGDVEILTDGGFKRFDICDGTEKVAQYTDSGEIEFVKPSEWIKKKYVGELIKWSPRNWCTIRMTPNHVQPLYFTKSKKIKEQYISDVNFSQSNNIIVAGAGCGYKKHLTAIDRLVIASQADGSIQNANKNYTHWSIQLAKQRKIDRFISICESENIPYTEIKSRSNFRRFTYDLPLSGSKRLSTHFSIAEFSYECAREFIEEIVQWDGYITNNYVQYVSTEKENCDFVSAVGCLGGYSTRQRMQIDNRKESYKNCHKVFLYDKLYSNCAHIKKTVCAEQYDDYTYCVRVPSHKIVVRAEGFVFVTGNCHALSNSAWQAMLKLLEEPPKKSIFIMCTTERNKVPKTILSRVQQFQFQRISQREIVDRLHYICEKEEIKHPVIPVATDYSHALEYISKLSSGGMRDAITMLDKCIAYSAELTLSNVLEALGVEDYHTFHELTGALIDKNEEMTIRIIESVHSEGKDLKTFMRDYTNFLLDLCKFDVTRSYEFIQIPTTENLSEKYNADDFWYFRDLLSVCIKLNERIKWDSSPKSMIEATLFLECNRGAE